MSYQNGIINHLIKNKIEIYFPDGDVEPIAEGNIVSESLTLKQSICDGEALTFGGCVASELNIKLINTAERQFSNELADKWISVKMTQYFADPDELVYPSDTLFPSGGIYPGTVTGERSFWIFSGYIDSATVDKNDKNVFNVTAYDALAKAYEEDATDLYYGWMTNTEGGRLEGILSLVVSRMAVECSGFLPLLNETYLVVKDGRTVTLRVGSFNVKNEYWLTRKDKVNCGMLLKNICEVLGVFGVIVPNADKGTFMPRKLSGNAETYAFYESLTTEDFESTGYTDFRFSVSGNTRKSKNVLGGGLSDAADGAVEKAYDFSDNVLVLQPYTAEGAGRTSTEFDSFVNSTSIGTRLAVNAESTEHAGQCAYSAYQPLTATLDGRLWVTVGSPIEILVSKTDVNGDYVLDENGNIQKETVKTYLLSRTLSGIQALTDKIEVKGVR